MSTKPGTLHLDPSGLYKIGQRYYQPTTGRWTQTDPLNRSTNPTNPPEASPYIYVGNNPINYSDPTGMSHIGCTGAMVASFAAVIGGIIGVITAGTGLLVLAGVLGIVGGVGSTIATIEACNPNLPH